MITPFITNFAPLCRELELYASFGARVADTCDPTGEVRLIDAGLDCPIAVAVENAFGMQLLDIACLRQLVGRRGHDLPDDVGIQVISERYIRRVA